MCVVCVAGSGVALTTAWESSEVMQVGSGFLCCSVCVCEHVCECVSVSFLAFLVYIHEAVHVQVSSPLMSVHLCMLSLTLCNLPHLHTFTPLPPPSMLHTLTPLPPPSMLHTLTPHTIHYLTYLPSHLSPHISHTTHLQSLQTYIPEGCTTKVATQHENKAKNRYLDALPCT